MVLAGQNLNSVQGAKNDSRVIKFFKSETLENVVVVVAQNQHTGF